MSFPPTTSESPSIAEQSRWFTEQVYSHDAHLKAYIRNSFPALHDVDDVIQESYLRIWKACTIRPIHAAKAFAFKVARHVALNLVERKRISPLTVVGDLSALPVIEEERLGARETVCRDEIFRLLVEALATLPPRCREIIVLRKLREMPQKEVAARLGLSEKTIEEQVSRGAKKCEDYLRKRGIAGFDSS